MLPVVGQSDEAPEMFFGGAVVGLLVVDVAEIVIGERIFRQTCCCVHLLELRQIFVGFGVIA